MKSNLYFTILICFSLIGCRNAQIEQKEVQPSSANSILIDVGHSQIYWDDPDDMRRKNGNFIGRFLIKERVKYLTKKIEENASSLNAAIGYLKGEINMEHLINCNILFIHLPSTKYSATEVNAITQYIQNGGSLFLAMDEDFFSTLEQTNVNEIISPFGILYGSQSPDTLSGGFTKAGLITDNSLRIPYHGGRIVKGGTPFCFINQTKDSPFGASITLESGGKIIIMGDAMTSLYMKKWKGVKDYQSKEFMHEVLYWLLN